MKTQKNKIKKIGGGIKYYSILGQFGSSKLNIEYQSRDLKDIYNYINKNFYNIKNNNYFNPDFPIKNEKDINKKNPIKRLVNTYYLKLYVVLSYGLMSNNITFFRKQITEYDILLNKKNYTYLVIYKKDKSVSCTKYFYNNKSINNIINIIKDYKENSKIILTDLYLKYKKNKHLVISKIKNNYYILFSDKMLFGMIKDDIFEILNKFLEKIERENFKKQLI